MLVSHRQTIWMLVSHRLTQTILVIRADNLTFISSDGRKLSNQSRCIANITLNHWVIVPGCSHARERCPGTRTGVKELKTTLILINQSWVTSEDLELRFWDYFLLAGFLQNSWKWSITHFCFRFWLSIYHFKEVVMKIPIYNGLIRPHTLRVVCFANLRIPHKPPNGFHRSQLWRSQLLAPSLATMLPIH